MTDSALRAAERAYAVDPSTATLQPLLSARVRGAPESWAWRVKAAALLGAEEAFQALGSAPCPCDGRDPSCAAVVHPLSAAMTTEQWLAQFHGYCQRALYARVAAACMHACWPSQAIHDTRSSFEQWIVCPCLAHGGEALAAAAAVSALDFAPWVWAPASLCVEPGSWLGVHPRPPRPRRHFEPLHDTEDGGVVPWSTWPRGYEVLESARQSVGTVIDDLERPWTGAFGAAVLLPSLKAEVVPWLLGTGDPVLARVVQRVSHGTCNPNVPTAVWQAHVQHPPSEEKTIGPLSYDPRVHCSACSRGYRRQNEEVAT